MFRPELIVIVDDTRVFLYAFYKKNSRREMKVELAEKPHFDNDYLTGFAWRRNIDFKADLDRISILFTKQTLD